MLDHVEGGRRDRLRLTAARWARHDRRASDAGTAHSRLLGRAEHDRRHDLVVTGPVIGVGRRFVGRRRIGELAVVQRGECGGPYVAARPRVQALGDRAGRRLRSFAEVQPDLGDHDRSVEGLRLGGDDLRAARAGSVGRRRAPPDEIRHSSEQARWHVDLGVSGQGPTTERPATVRPATVRHVGFEAFTDRLVGDQLAQFEIADPCDRDRAEHRAAEEFAARDRRRDPSADQRRPRGRGRTGRDEPEPADPQIALFAVEAGTLHQIDDGVAAIAGVEGGFRTRPERHAEEPHGIERDQDAVGDRVPGVGARVARRCQIGQHPQGGDRVIAHGYSAVARDRMTLGAALRVSLHDRGQVDVELVGEAGDPGEHVTELVLDLLGGAIADRLGELAELLRQPGDAVREFATSIAGAVRALDDVLQLGEFHAATVARWW